MPDIAPMNVNPTINTFHVVDAPNWNQSKREHWERPLLTTMNEDAVVVLRNERVVIAGDQSKVWKELPESARLRSFELHALVWPGEQSTSRPGPESGGKKFTLEKEFDRSDLLVTIWPKETGSGNQVGLTIRTSLESRKQFLDVLEKHFDIGKATFDVWSGQNNKAGDEITLSQVRAVQGDDDIDTIHVTFDNYYLRWTAPSSTFAELGYQSDVAEVLDRLEVSGPTAGDFLIISQAYDRELIKTLVGEVGVPTAVAQSRDLMKYLDQYAEADLVNLPDVQANDIGHSF